MGEGKVRRIVAPMMERAAAASPPSRAGLDLGFGSRLPREALEAPCGLSAAPLP